MDETENVIKTLPFQVRYIRAAATEGGSLYWGSDLWTGLIWEKATERPHVFSVSALNTTRSSAYTWTRTDPHFPRCLSFFLFSSTLWNTLIYIWSCLLKAVVSPRCGGWGGLLGVKRSSDIQPLTPISHLQCVPRHRGDPDENVV